MDQLQQAMAVFVVLALLAAVLYVLRSRGMVQFTGRTPGLASERKLQPVERLSLTASHSLHLVRVSGKLVLIAVSPTGCAVLDGEPEGSQGSRP